MPDPLDLSALAARVGPPDEAAHAAALERQDRLAKPRGALGRLEELSAWLASVEGRCPPQPLRRVRVVVFAGDHGVASANGAGVSAYPGEVTAQMVRTFLAGTAAVSVLAETVGASVRVVDLAVDDDLAGAPAEVSALKVRRGSGRIDVEDALSREQAEQAFLAGVRLADEEVDSGADLLIPGDMGIGNTTPASVLTLVLSDAEVAELVGRGSGIDDRTWMRKCAAVRDAARRARPFRGDPLALLATAGGADIAAMSGFLVQAAVRRTPVILDGVVSGAAARVAQQVSEPAVRWWVAGHRSPEPAHSVALAKLGLEPLLDYGLRLGEGSGALLAVPMLQAATATLARMATFDEAGVSDR